MINLPVRESFWGIRVCLYTILASCWRVLLVGMGNGYYQDNAMLQVSCHNKYLCATSFQLGPDIRNLSCMNHSCHWQWSSSRLLLRNCQTQCSFPTGTGILSIIFSTVPFLIPRSLSQLECNVLAEWLGKRGAFCNLKRIDESEEHSIGVPIPVA